MGNKYVNFLVFAVFLMGSGVVYQKYYRPKEIGCVAPTGNVVTLDVRSIKDQWKFSPENIIVKKGDKVMLNIFNEDDYDHGFAIEAFGVNKRLFPGAVTPVEFVACKVGIYPFYCSVACGEGHYRQTGNVIVEE